MSIAIPTRNIPGRTVVGSESTLGSSPRRVRMTGNSRSDYGMTVRSRSGVREAHSIRRPSRVRVSRDVRSDMGHPRGGAIRAVAPNLKRIGFTVLFGLFLAFGFIYAWTATNPEFEAVPTATHSVTVQSGDTLSSLAATYAPDASSADVVARIVALNELNTSGVEVGQVLSVPVDAESARVR